MGFVAGCGLFLIYFFLFTSSSQLPSHRVFSNSDLKFTWIRLNTQTSNHSGCFQMCTEYILIYLFMYLSPVWKYEYSMSHLRIVLDLLKNALLIPEDYIRENG